VHGLAPYLDLN